MSGHISKKTRSSSSAAVAAPAQQHKQQPQNQMNESEEEEEGDEIDEQHSPVELLDDVDASSMSVSSSTDHVLTVADTSIIREVKENSRHFSKLAARFTFESNTTAYTSWKVLFTTEMEQYELADVLRTDPSSIVKGQLSPSQMLVNKHKQKAVYHMIVHCVPKSVLNAVTTSLPVSEHTGFHAWKTLREYFIGDENQYLNALESKFQLVAWDEKEEFPSFELRYESLLNELENAGVGKIEHVKRSGMMRAIENC